MANIHDRRRSGRLHKTTARDDSLLVRMSKARSMSTASQLQEEWTPATPVSSRTVCRILARNGLHGPIAAQKLALNKRQLRNHVAYAKAHSLTEGWKAEKWQKNFCSDESSVDLHPKHCQYCLTTLRGPSGPTVHPEYKFGGGKILVWGYIQYRCAREICKVDGNIDGAKYSIQFNSILFV